MKKRKWYWWLGLAIIVRTVYALVSSIHYGLWGFLDNPERLGLCFGAIIGLSVGVWLMCKGRRRVSPAAPTTLKSKNNQG